MRKTGLSWELVLEIAQYLSLNDAISTFSIDILSLLNYPHSKFHLSNPCDPFITKILPKIGTKKIVSLQFNPSRLLSKSQLSFLSHFTEVRSVTIHNSPESNAIHEYIQCFPKLICLCLHYDKKGNYSELKGMLHQCEHQIKRLEIHHPGISYTCSDKKRSENEDRTTTNVQCFLLDISHKHLIPTNDCGWHQQSDFIMPLSEFMKKMSHVQYIHVIMNKNDIEPFLDDDPWKRIVNICSGLKKIRLQVLRSTAQDEQFLRRKILEIQTILRNIRQIIKFQINFL